MSCPLGPCDLHHERAVAQEYGIPFLRRSDHDARLLGRSPRTRRGREYIERQTGCSSGLKGYGTGFDRLAVRQLSNTAAQPPSMAPALHQEACDPRADTSCSLPQFGVGPSKPQAMSIRKSSPSYVHHPRLFSPLKFIYPHPSSICTIEIKPQPQLDGRCGC